MKQLEYLAPTEVADAVAAVAGDSQAQFLAGGTNLVDHLKLGVCTPDTLIDVRKLPLHDVEETDAGLRIGANVTNSDLAAHPAVRAGWPAVARALLAGASPQIRNQATTGGNLLQRTRCVYFQDVTTACNKREPGSGCSAIGGYERHNAVLGASDACVAAHPSDLAVALTALDADVIALGPTGRRHLPVADLHRLPGEHPDKDTVLEHGELITAVDLPATQLARNSTYVKVRDRASFAFALVSVAAALRMEDGFIAEVALAWGGVAHTPWRATRAEAALLGQQVTEDNIAAAVDAELQDAQFSADTAYKRPMLRGATVSALLQLRGEEN